MANDEAVVTTLDSQVEERIDVEKSFRIDMLHNTPIQNDRGLFGSKSFGPAIKNDS